VQLQPRTVGCQHSQTLLVRTIARQRGLLAPSCDTNCALEVSLAFGFNFALTCSVNRAFQSRLELVTRTSGHNGDTFAPDRRVFHWACCRDCEEPERVACSGDRDWVCQNGVHTLPAVRHTTQIGHRWWQVARAQKAGSRSGLVCEWAHRQAHQPDNTTWPRQLWPPASAHTWGARSACVSRIWETQSRQKWKTPRSECAIRKTRLHSLGSSWRLIGHPAPDLDTHVDISSRRYSNGKKIPLGWADRVPRVSCWTRVVLECHMGRASWPYRGRIK